METPAQFSVGEARVTLLRLGALQVRLAAWLGLPEPAWPTDCHALFAQPIALPVQAVHLATEGRSILIDPSHPELLPLVGELPPDAPPVPGLLDQLAAAQLDPAAVDTVVITHAHVDHFSGLIAVGATPAEDRLLFPNADHYIGAADWAALQSELQQPESAAARTLGLVARCARLEPVEGERDLGAGVRLLPTPGETPGHLAVQLEAGGATLYIVGDLYHHAVEVANPAWCVTWADPQATAASRAWLERAALREDARLIAAHIPSFGRLRSVADGVVWEPLL
jgi:glyoxylase-like metal-dependent hydrolase (beta-lactamase superfamily II)